MLNICLTASQSFEIPLLEILSLYFASFLVELFNLLVSHCLSSLYFSDNGHLSDGVVRNLFPLYGVLFCPFDSVLYLTETFQFYVAPFINFPP